MAGLKLKIPQLDLGGLKGGPEAPNATDLAIEELGAEQLLLSHLQVWSFPLVPNGGASQVLSEPLLAC